MANKVIIDIEARFLDKVSSAAGSASKALDGIDKKAKTAKKGLEQLNKTKAKPTITVEDSKFTKAIDKHQKRLEKLGKTKAAAILSVVDKASHQLDRVRAKAAAWGRSKWASVLSVRDMNASQILGKVMGLGKQLVRTPWRMIVSVKDMATGTLRGIKNTILNIKTLAGTIIAGYAVKRATNMLISNPVGVADSIESSRIAFETKLGSAQKAEEFLQKIYKFDEKSPFDTLQIVGIAQQMMNMGWQANNVLGDLGIIGDWAASMGKGEQGIASVTRALGQMRQKGRLSAEEMLQLTEAGVSGWDYLAKYLGKTIPEVRELAEDGEIDVNTAIKGIIAGMSEFEGAAAATSDRTVKGIMDQVGSLINTYIKLPWGEGLATGFKRGLGQIRDLLDENKDKFKEWGATLKEIGTEVSTYIADKVEHIIATIKEITGSDAFKNASGKGKLGLLWDGLIADPISAWWQGGGRDALMDTTIAIGKFIGEGIFKGLMEFISSHPIASLFIAGGMGLKNLGGGSILGGAVNIGRNIGSAAAGTGILGFGANTAIGLGAGNLAGGASLSAGALSALGLGAAAGGLAGGVSAVSGAYDLYKGFKEGDTSKKVSGGFKLGGVGAGAAAGAALGSVIPGLGTAVGGLIGAGVGGVVGWFTGKKAADQYAESTDKAAGTIKTLTENERKLANTSLEKHFGDVTLSADEMEQTIRRMVGESYFEETEAATKALNTMKESLAAFEEQDTFLKKSTWLASYKKGAKLTASEIKGLKESAKAFSSSAQNYLTDTQYAATESITAILGNSKEAKKLIDSTNEYYTSRSEKVGDLSKKLNKAIADATSKNSEGGITITANEKASIDKIRGQISNIVRKIENEEYQAEVNILKAKYLGDLTPEGFGEFMKGAADKNKGLAESYWNEFGTASIGKAEEEIEILREGVRDKLANMWAGTGDLGLGTLREQYSEELGVLSKEINWLLTEKTPEEIMNSASGLSKDTKNAIKLMMESMKPTTEEVEKLVKQYEEAGKKPPEALTNYLKSAEFFEAVSEDRAALLEYFNNWDIKISPTVTVTPQYKISGSTVYGNPKMNYAAKQSLLMGHARFRGGIEGFADGGYVHGGGKLIRVAEEGDSEAIIPLGMRRRQRALELYNQVGDILGADSINRDAPVIQGNFGGGGGNISIEVGGIELNVQVDGGKNVVEAIQNQKEALAEEIAGILNKAISAQYANMPSKKGA